MSSVISTTLTTIARALGRSASDAAEGWQENDEADCTVFSYRRDFATLWGLGSGGIAQIAQSLGKGRGGKGSEHILVIVWDGVPDTEVIGISRYVTPYDWATALSLAIYREKSGGAPKLRFLILNLPSAPQDSFFQRNLFAFHNVVPWIQGYQVSTRDDIGVPELALRDFGNPTDIAFMRQVVPPSRQQVSDLLDDLREPRRIVSTFADDDDPKMRGQYLETLSEVWQQEFLKPGDRHKVGNLLGPLLLADGLGSELRNKVIDVIKACSWSRQALVLLLNELGLIHLAFNAKTEAGELRKPDQIGLSRDGGVFGRRRNVRFLLVDDQFRLGYQHVLACMLFGTDYDPTKTRSSDNDWSYNGELAELTCVSSAEALFKVLEDQPRVEDWGLPRKLDIPDCDICLLDLRLWMDGTATSKEFMGRLVSVCRKLGGQNLSDSRFQQALRAAQRIADGDTGNELTALPLLALLLSHYDPSFPIVLFSSTHQRDVIELVAHRPNIVTSFAKPLLLGYGETQQPLAMVNALGVGLRRAIDLHEARMIWERINDVSWGSSPVFRLNTNWEKGGNLKQETFNAGNGNMFSPGDSLVLRKALAALFIDYFQGSNYFDFAAQPFEFLEGCLTPPNVARRISNPGFDLEDRTHGVGGVPILEEQKLRNSLGRALQSIRNRKAHGHVKRPLNFSEREQWRLASILEFAVLLDYVSASTSELLGKKNNLEELHVRYWDALRAKHQIILGRYCSRPTPPAAHEIGSIAGFPWLPYVTLATAQGVIRSCKGDVFMASQATVSALERLLTPNSSPGDMSMPPVAFIAKT
jgi:hypothetical protein